MNINQPFCMQKLPYVTVNGFTIGSYNVNDISAYASIELNLDVRDPGFATQVDQKLQAILRVECVPITLEKHTRTKNIFKQFIRWFSYEFIRVVVLHVYLLL
jgi:cardiolipin synthase